MALAGLKKQFNKANQYMSEKIGGAEGTKFTDEFTTLERKTDLTNELVDELINKTKEYLQPNPASRTKLMVSSKLKGTPGRPHAYPQPEGVLGEIMCKFGKDLGDDTGSPFAQSLNEMGEAMKELAEVKYSLEDNVKQNFLEPLTHLQAKDLKDVMFHRKKLEGRRLDYDCKKRKRTKGTNVMEEEIKLAEDKFEESFNLASMGMHNLLQNEIEQLSQVCVLAESLYEYHQQCTAVLESLNARLAEIKNEAAQKSYQPYVPKKLHELNLIAPSIGHLDDLSPGDAHMNGSKLHSTSTFHTNNNHYSSSLSLNRTTSNPRPVSVYPNLGSKSTASSPSWSTSSKQTNGHMNGVTNSTTAYLLSGKASNALAQKSQFQSNFSKSIPNVSSLNANGSYFESDRVSNRSNNMDLLGSIEAEASATDWDEPQSRGFSQSYSTSSDYRSSTHFSSSISPSAEHPSKPTNLFLDTAKVNSNARTPTDRGPSAQALYDFDPENENELAFKEGDIITLVSQIDENWYEGSVSGRTGLFPVSYVQVLVPLTANGR